MKLMNEKKMMLGGGNGGYVMPKIFCINFEAERLKQQEQLNLITTGKKIQNVLNYDG